MAINVRADEDTGELTVEFVGPWQGLDTKSPPMQIAENHLPGLQNVDLPEGVPTRVDGFALHATSFDTGTSVPNLLARYIPSTGDAFYITADESGNVYSHVSAGGAPTSLRQGLSTTAGLYWTHTQLADYLIIANPTDGNYKWDGTRLIPLGAKYIADMETAEDATWVGGATSTTVREGTQSRTRTSTGAAVTVALTPATAWDLTDGLYSAIDYSTTTSRIHFYINIDVAANVDLTTTYIRFGDAADTAYFQAAASVANWGTLANGWNRVQIAKSLFATTGAPSWASIAKLTFAFDATGANTVIFIVDDCYLRYSDALTMPSVQYVSDWKNMVLGARSTADPSTFYFARVSAPDEYTATASFPVNEDDEDTITGMHPFYNQVLITKDNSCHSISGTVAGTVYPNYNLETLLVTTDHGGSSHRALVQAGNYIYIWWRGELHRYNGTGTEKVSRSVDPTLATVNMARLSQIVGARRRPLNQIFWYYPDGAATTNDTGLRYDYLIDGFMSMTGQTMALATQVFESGIEYLLTAEYDGDIMRQDNGADYAGTSITAFVTMPWVSAQLANELKTWLEVYVPYETNTGDLIVEYRLANHPREMAAASFVTAGTIVQDVVGEYGRAFIGNNSVWIQLRFRTVNARMTLFSPILLKAVRLGAAF